MDFMRLKHGFIIDGVIGGQTQDRPKVEQPGMV